VVDEIPSQSGKPYKRTTYVMEAETFMLLASSLELNAGPDTAGDEDSFLDSMLDSIRNGFGDKFQLDSKGGVTAVTLAPNNLKGRQLRATVEGHPMIIRAYVGKRTIYTMQVSHMQGDQAAAKTGERFLESLVVKSP